MTIEIKLPPLGDDAGEEAEVSFWYADPGETVEEGDDLVEMVTDKAAFTVPAPASGTITEILAPEGAKVQVGEVMAHIQQ
jgi:pyruvate/2-oxoglutarate dehydrogenase complex dihydrolipoamide acyltransferase (E2) component